MKKTLVYSFILTCILIFAPAFMVQFDEEVKQTVNIDKTNTDNVNKLNKKDVTDDYNSIFIKYLL